MRPAAAIPAHGSVRCSNSGAAAPELRRPAAGTAASGFCRAAAAGGVVAAATAVLGGEVGACMELMLPAVCKCSASWQIESGGSYHFFSDKDCLKLTVQHLLNTMEA